jgi:hypothetical protein
MKSVSLRAQPPPVILIGVKLKAAEGVRDVEVEVRAFFLIRFTLLNVLVRKGKGPEGQSCPAR